MIVVKKAYSMIVKPKNDLCICIKCNRTEKQLVGVNDIGHSIFNQENLCIDCEILTYPERFHGCGFCKRPIRERFSCMTCSDGFVEWINDVIHPIDSLSVMIRKSAHGLLDRNIHDISLDHRLFILREEDGYYKWPGFYAGLTDKFSPKPDDHHDDTITETTAIVPILAHDSQNVYLPVWIVPKLTNGYDVSFADLHLDLKIFQTILLNILEKNNIYLYEDVQINLSSMKNEQIRTVNPYDTRIMKKY